MRRIALCCVSLALASCSLFWDTSSFTSDEPTDAGTGTDTSAETSSSSSSGGPSEGGTNDAGQDSATSFCASLNPKPKFCSDFDDGASLVVAGWGVNVDPPDAGSVTIDPMGRDRSCALAKLDAPQSCSYARPTRTFVTDGKGLRVAYAFRPSSTKWQGDAAFSVVALQGGCRLLYHFDGANASLHLQFGSPEQDESFGWAVTPKLDAWSKIETTISADANITITVDGVIALSRALSAGCGFGTSVFVAPGLHCESDPHEARYDDVVVDYP